MRRRPGVGGVQAVQQRSEHFQAEGAKLTEQLMRQMGEGLETFKQSLEEFARKYKKEINENPLFRRDFHKMCLDIGVDPLACFWGELLGVGDFYYELAVQVVDVCMATREANGGLIDIGELLKHILRLRGRNAIVGSMMSQITTDDLERAISKLAVLGGGYKVLRVGGHVLVQSVPVELNKDHIDVLALAEKTGYVSVSMAMQQLRWPSHRIDSVLKLLLQESLVWLDTQDQEELYWVPSLVSNLF